jgi:very-short-patch-repair endonuclease
MRREMTAPERKLWYQLRAKRFQTVKFRRQHVIGPYIADFYSREAMLVIEVDGDTHAFQQDYDRVREGYMHNLGFRVLRFTSSEVTRNMDGVWLAICEAVTAPLQAALAPMEQASLSSPLKGRGGAV